MIKYKLAWRYFKNHKFTQDEKRNLRLGGVVSVYGFAFAAEKLFIIAGNQLNDYWWFAIYGICAALSFYWWFEDLIFDIWEKYTTEDDELYAQATISQKVTDGPVFPHKVTKG